MIAEHLRTMATLKTPIVSVIIGEGGSGGALALSLGDRLVMLENSYFSVISPEGCASILFKDSSLAREAAENLKLTAVDLMESNMVDHVIREPEDFDRWHMEPCVRELKKDIRTTLTRLMRIPPDRLVESRHEKYLGMRGILVDSFG